MAVLDIGLLPGFTVNPDDLNLVRAFADSHRPTHSEKFSVPDREKPSVFYGLVV